jgi:hypothetical protein
VSTADLSCQKWTDVDDNADGEHTPSERLDNDVEGVDTVHSHQNRRRTDLLGSRALDVGT